MDAKEKAQGTVEILTAMDAKEKAQGTVEILTAMDARKKNAIPGVQKWQCFGALHL